MPETQENLKFPNLPQLRIECIKRLRRKPLEPFTDREVFVISALVGVEAGKRKNVRNEYPPKFPHDEEHGIRTLIRDIDDPKYSLPKWVALVSWLSMDGLASTLPSAVGNAALYCLGYNQKEIEALIPKECLEFEP